MNYPDIFLAAVAAGSLAISAGVFAYHKIADPVQKTHGIVMVDSQDARLSNIEKRLDEAVAVQEVMIRKLESLQAKSVKQDED